MVRVVLVEIRKFQKAIKLNLITFLFILIYFFIDLPLGTHSSFVIKNQKYEDNFSKENKKSLEIQS